MFEHGERLLRARQVAVLQGLPQGVQRLLNLDGRFTMMVLALRPFGVLLKHLLNLRVIF